MSNTSTGNSTMNTASKNTTKRVSKKTETPAAPVAAPVAAPTPVVEAPKAKKVKPTVAATPVADAPVATAVAEAAAPVESKTIEQEITALIETNQKIRDAAVNSIKSLQRLQKRVNKELKEASRRRRRNRKEESADGTKVKRPTIFTTPVTLKDELCAFLGKSKGTQMTPADVTRACSAYVEAHKLKDAEKGHTIHPDAAMRKVLGVKDGETLTYRNIQSYLYKLYELPEKKKSA